MKDRISPCVHYTYAHGECKKRFKDVTLKKCKNCKKYTPRKQNKEKPFRLKKQKDIDRHEDIDRHDDWRSYFM